MKDVTAERHLYHDQQVFLQCFDHLQALEMSFFRLSLVGQHQQKVCLSKI